MSIIQVFNILLANICVGIGAATLAIAGYLHPEIISAARLVGSLVLTVGILGTASAMLNLARRLRCCYHRH